MHLEILGISVLWIFLFGYLIVASIDFGAGFFNTYSEWTRKDYIIRPVIQRYLSPVWEVTNVFLVFFFIGIVGFFPQTAYYYGTVLLIPLSISIILLAIRGSYYAFSTYGDKNSKIHRLLYGLTGVFIPASLTIVLSVSEGGFIGKKNGTIQLLYGKLLASGYAWSVVLLAVISVLFISACFLAYYAVKAGDAQATALLRSYALSWSVPAILVALLTFYALKLHNAVHYKNMVTGMWPLFLLSIICFIIAVTLIYKKIKYGLAFVMVTLQYFFAFLGYGISHYPYLIYTQLTIFSGFTNQPMAIALVVAFIAGLGLLIPSLYLLLHLFLFNKDYVKGKGK